MYPNTEGGRFDLPYYCNTHMRLVRELIGPALKGLRVEQGIGGGAPGSAPTYIALGHLEFDSVEAAEKALQTHAPALMSDIPNFTNLEPVMQFSEVTLDS